VQALKLHLGDDVRHFQRDPRFKYPITGIAACCARADSGQATVGLRGKRNRCGIKATALAGPRSFGARE